MLQMPSTELLLHELVAEAGLPPVADAVPITGHGFDHQVVRATLVDSQQVVLRRFAACTPYGSRVGCPDGSAPTA